jgi:hypothetical protein
MPRTAPKNPKRKVARKGVCGRFGATGSVDRLSQNQQRPTATSSAVSDWNHLSARRSARQYLACFGQRLGSASPRKKTGQPAPILLDRLHPVGWNDRCANVLACPKQGIGVRRPGRATGDIAWSPFPSADNVPECPAAALSLQKEFAMNRSVIGLFAAALILSLDGALGTAEEKGLPVEVQDAFKRFAAAVKDDNYDEAARWIAPPADKVWTNFAPVRTAAAKYEAALEEKFGKSEERPLLGVLSKKGGLAEHFYEVQGEIQEVKPAGKDQALVRVWTKRPDWRKLSETALYERTFTAAKIGDQWKFQLHTFGGTPVLKKVKRTASDGKEVEVYAEHYPKGGPDEKNWVQLPPISYDGREEFLKQEAAELVKFAEALRTQTEQVMTGTYKTREEALKALAKARPRP